MPYPILRSALVRMNPRPLAARVRKLFYTLRNVKKFIPLHNKMCDMRDEINLLTSYSSDTVYRLKYDSMTYEYISPAVVRLLGFSPEEIKKMNFRSLILETRMVNDNMQNITSFDELEQARKSGNVSKWQVDYLMRCKDARKIWVTDISFPWFDEAGAIIGSVGSLRDITDRVNAEKNFREEMVRMAHTDRLTGIANRHTFFSTIDNEIRRFKRSQRHFAILLIDIDHFKKINDDYSHEVGDQVLVEISGIIASCVRDTDMLARLDGEEFGVFLPETNEESAYWVAERVCKEVAKHCFFIENQAIPKHVTVSIGVASTKDKILPTAEDIYKKADTRLYIAKHTGRNQVSVDEIVHMH